MAYKKQEKKYENYLRKLLDEVRLESYEKQIKIRTKYSPKSVQPDIIAYRKRVDCIYVFEVKDTTSIRGIGQTFGQLVATKFGFQKMDLEKRKKLLRKGISLLKTKTSALPLLFYTN